MSLIFFFSTIILFVHIFSTMALFDGILKTPLTDLQFAMLPLYFMKERVPLCAKLQMKYVDCVEAYGMKQSLNKCGDLYFDLIECSQSSYQVSL